MDETQSKKRILIFPWLAHGHITPLLELAKKLSRRNLHIYFCATPINLTSIKKKLDENSYPSIQLIEFNLPSPPDLPPQHHTTNGLPPHLLPTLISTFNEAGPPFFSQILNTLTPDFVIYDHHQLWAPIIASSRNIPAALFVVTAALPIAMMLHVSNNPDNPFPFPEISCSWLKTLMMAKNIAEATADEARKELHNQYLDSLIEPCDIILINSFGDLEGKYMEYLSILSRKKIVPVGPLLEAPLGDNDNDDQIIQWLDKKSESSVVYASFGSESFLNKEEITEIAHGLEISEVNFIWVMRFPSGENIRAEEALPEGFRKRVGDRGKIVEGWAPQVKILSHSSTGGFVCHCGWNSLLETMRFGVPIIAVPLLYDQPMNAKLVEGLGFGAEVKRDENGRLSREGIAKLLRKIVVEEDGEEIRSKARDLREKMVKKGEEEIDEAMEQILALVSKNKIKSQV